MMVRMLESTAVILSLLWVYVIGAPLFGKIEGHILPVAELSIEVREYDAADELLMIGGNVNKIRGCVWLGNRAYSEELEIHNRKRIVYDDRVDDGQDQSRPEGVSFFGPWWIYDVEPETKIILESVHQCHGLWKTTTHLAEIEIGN